MDDKIKAIFIKNIELISLADKIVYYFHIQNFDMALRLSTSVINHMGTNLETLLLNSSYFNENNILIDHKLINSMLNDLLNAIDNRDYILAADLYEMQMIPFWSHLQETIIMKEDFVFDDIRFSRSLNCLKLRNKNLENQIEALSHPLGLYEKGYQVEFTSCGLMTLAMQDKGDKYYLHSNNRIVRESITLANAWMSDEISEYIIYGLGLGYHIKALAELDENVSIKVFESDINIIQLACAYTDLGAILGNPNMEFIYDPDFTKLFLQLQGINDTAKFLIHYPSLRNIKDNTIREKLENYFLQYSSIENQRKLLNANFRENIHHYDAFVDELKNNFKDKDLYIVAAGPSLDKNFKQLEKADKTKSIILATGTVFRKLLNAGITPDYFIVTDANARVYHQIAGYESSNVPMLYLSSVYKGFAQNYKGRKYMICQKDYDKAEEFARETNTMLFQTGGSVSTTALDIGISFECKRIIFLGLDLAYTDNYVHATGTSRRDLASTEDLRQIADIHGNKIYTSKSLDIYRQWIENRIRNVKGIEFIDATEGGARIEGMKLMKLSECLSQ